MKRIVISLVALGGLLLGGCAATSSWTPPTYDLSDPFYTSKTSPL